MNPHPFHTFGWSFRDTLLGMYGFKAFSKLNRFEQVHYSRSISVGQRHDRRNHPTKRPSSRRVR